MKPVAIQQEVLSAIVVLGHKATIATPKKIREVLNNTVTETKIYGAVGWLSKKGLVEKGYVDNKFRVYYYLTPQGKEFYLHNTILAPGENMRVTGKDARPKAPAMLKSYIDATLAGMHRVSNTTLETYRKHLSKTIACLPEDLNTMAVPDVTCMVKQLSKHYQSWITVSTCLSLLQKLLIVAQGRGAKVHGRINKAIESQRKGCAYLGKQAKLDLDARLSQADLFLDQGVASDPTAVYPGKVILQGEMASDPTDEPLKPRGGFFRRLFSSLSGLFSGRSE
jgi:DNA-binding PadR family transcriptional regulator